MTTNGNEEYPSPNTIFLDRQEPMPMTVAQSDTVFVTVSGTGEMAVGDDNVVPLVHGKNVAVNRGTQYQILWGSNLTVTLTYPNS